MPIKTGKRILLPAFVILAMASLAYWSTATEQSDADAGSRFSHHANVNDPTGARLLWEPCERDPDIPLMTIGCGWLGFDDDHLGETWIPVAVFSPEGAVNTPVIYLPGGPGGSAWLEDFGLEGWAYWWQMVDTPRDLVVFDPRGTGIGMPVPQCDRLAEQRKIHLASSPGPDQENLDVVLALILCADDMRREGIHLKGFSTARMVEDVDLIARLLQASQGYSHFHLYGVSYGTRLALQISRHKPDWLESMVLDGLYPPDEDALPDWPRLLDALLSRIDQTCAEAAWCREQFGDTGVPVMALAHQLEDAPVMRTLQWEDGRHQRVALSGLRLLDALVADAYTDETLPFLPLMLSRFIDGDESALDMLLWNLIAFEDDPSFNRLVFTAVDCQDSPVPDRTRWREIREEHPLYQRFVSREIDDKVCPHMRLPHAEPAWRALEQIDTRVLLVSAALDPITPPASAERAAAYLPQSQHLVVTPGVHGATFSHPCAQAAMRDFWAGAETLVNCGNGSLPIAAINDNDRLDTLIRQTANFWGFQLPD